MADTVLPEGQSASEGAPAHRTLALLVDFDNLFLGLTGAGVRGVTPASVLQVLESAVEPLGSLSVARVYIPDPARFEGIRDSLAAHDFELVTTTVPRWGTGDTDVLMVMHGQELLFTRPDITTFVLASGDSDFAPLARAIVERGKRLIVLCPKAVASTVLLSIAHEFIALEPLMTGTSTPPSSLPSSPQAEGDRRASRTASRPRSRRARPPAWDVPPASHTPPGSDAVSEPKTPSAPNAARTSIESPASLASQSPAPVAKRRKLRVFLCHSKHDKAAVRRLYTRLHEEEGIQPWMDENDLLPGQDWKREITRQVATTDCVLVCLSVRAIEGVGYVQTEIGFALEAAQRQPEGAIFLIPVKFEECDLPDRLARFHWVNLFDEDGHTLMMRALRSRADAL